MLTQTINLFETYPSICKKMSDYYQYIMVDEYQDSNLLQMQLIKQLRQFENKNICVVGDPKQCFPAGTKITTNNGLINIEDIKVGDQVLSANGRSKTTYGIVEDISKKSYTGELVKIITESGKTVSATPEHIIFADTNIDDAYFVYLMYKEKLGYRIGQSRNYPYARETIKNGPKQRMNQESADKIWILGVYKTQKEATYYEQYYAYQYGLPLYVFKASHKRIILSQEDIDNLFHNIDTESRAKKLLNDKGLFLQYPHYQRACLGKGSNEIQRIRLTLFGSNRFGNHNEYVGYKHELAYNTVNENFNSIAEKYFTNKGSHKKNVRGLEYYNGRKVLNDMDYLSELAYSIQKDLPKTAFIRTAILTNSNTRFELIPFANVLSGMTIAINNNGEIIKDKVISVERINYNGYVYDLNIKNYRNYISNGVCVHNCIYGFRGSLYENILNFPDMFDDCKIVKLNKNYRSNQEILDLSNSVTSSTDERFKNELIGTHHCGYKPKLVKVNTQNDEARYILNKINKYRREGVSLNDMAVLIRGSYDSNMLESLIMEQSGRNPIEYQKYGGIKFFEREFVKNIFAFLKILINYKDEISWFRILKLYPGIGPVNAKKITEGIIENGTKELDDTKYVKKKFAEYLPEILDYINDMNGMDFQEQIEYLVNDYYYKTMQRSIKNMKTTPANIKKKLKELDDEIVQAQVLIKLSENYKTVNKFVNDLLLEVPPENVDGEKLTISTIHSIKGLEFKVVFVLGCIEGKFPWLKEPRAATDEAIEEWKQEEAEERRVFYVAITRAKDDLYLMYPQYNIFTKETTTLTRFLAEDNKYHDFCDIELYY